MKFLDAEWRYLIMLNYQIDPDVLSAYVPSGVEIDFFNNRTFVSLVGFLFLSTRVLGVPIPFHRNFEEVNLRFYVRRKGPEGWRRGVAFIKEIVPKRAIASIARTLYNENYVAMPMRHRIHESDDGLRSVKYEWFPGQTWNSISVSALPECSPLIDGSEEEFIAEHYWGYSAQRDGSTVEYQVQHPRWNVYRLQSMGVDCDFSNIYDKCFEPFLQQSPASGFLADGSRVSVSTGKKLAKASVSADERSTFRV